MSAAAWAAAAERGSVLGMRFTAWLYRRCGRRVAAGLVSVIVAYFFVTDPQGRRASRRYLQRVYATPGGAAALGRPPRTRDCFRHYLQFGLSTLDRVRLAVGSHDDIAVTLHGGEHLAGLVARGQGAVLVGVHLGNFDALRALAARNGIKVSIVMSTRHAARITSVLRRLDPAADVRVVDLDPSAQSVFTLRASVARGEFVAILGDRVAPGRRVRSVRAPFLGASAPFPRGPFVLAATLKCPLVLMVALRRGPGHYDVYAESLADGSSEAQPVGRDWLVAAVNDYARRIERYCLRAPYQWFNFYDFWDEDAPGRRAPV